MPIDAEAAQSALGEMMAAGDCAGCAAALKILGKLLSNVRDHPLEPKYRKIKLSNKTIQAKLVPPANGAALRALEALSFARAEVDGAPCMVLRTPAHQDPNGYWTSFGEAMGEVCAQIATAQATLEEWAAQG